MSMSLRENITAVIETCFSETKDEIQDTAINRILEMIRADRKDEPQICDTCRHYNSNIPCGSTPSACKEADKFAKEFVDGLKKLKPKTEPQPTTDCSQMESSTNEGKVQLTDCAWKKGESEGWEQETRSE